MLHLFRVRSTWLLLGPIAVCLLVITGIFTLRGPFSVHAAGITLYVGSTVGSNSGCLSPGFTSVQTAVDVANPGATVYLCGTTPYAEQVIISKSLTLTGEPGAGIVAPITFPNSLSRLPSQFTTDNLFVPQADVVVWGASTNVKIKNLSIAGVMPSNGGCAEQDFGLLVIADGTVVLTGDQVNDIRDANPAMYGCQFGVGIQVGREYWPTATFGTSGIFMLENFVGHATIGTTSVIGYQKNGMTVDGPGTTATITGSTVTGAGRSSVLSSDIAQNGIQVSRGASAQVQHDTVTNNTYLGPGGASDGGILVYGGSCDGPATPLTTNTKVQFNSVQDNDVGAFVSNLSVDGNSLCSLPVTATNVTVSQNVIKNSAASNVSGSNLLNFPGGYQAGISDEGNTDQLTKNQICGVGYTTVAPPPYLSFIDMVATNPTVSGNTACASSTGVDAAASAKAAKKHGLHYIVKPIK